MEFFLIQDRTHTTENENGYQGRWDLSLYFLNEFGPQVPTSLDTNTVTWRRINCLSGTEFFVFVFVVTYISFRMNYNIFITEIHEISSDTSPPTKRDTQTIYFERRCKKTISIEYEIWNIYWTSPFRYRYDNFFTFEIVS